MKNLTIYIVDDHKMFCEGIKIILESNMELPKIKLFSNAKDAIESINFYTPDILISDISMPGMNGLEFINIIRNKFPSIKILILTMHNSISYVQEAISAGINGYILKDSKAAEVLTAIQMILDDKLYISPNIQTKTSRFINDEVELTPREIAVLNQIAIGNNSNIIAENLFISIHTVESHRKNMLAKTGCKNSVDLCIWGISKGYIKS